MKRILDVNQIMTGTEPKFNTILTKIQLIQTLNWYSQNKASKDSLKYASDYFKKKHKITSIDDILKQYSSSFGFICRIISNGGILNDFEQKSFNEFIDDVLKECKIKNNVEKSEKPNNVISIQERVNEKVSEIIGDLEGSIDEYIENNFKREPSPTAIMQDRTKSMHAKRIVSWFKEKRIEYDTILNTKDSEIKEAYSNFKKPDLKKIIAYIDKIINEALIIDSVKQKSKKPRKRKVKTPEQLVTKMQYKEKDDDFGIVSVTPRDIIGTMQIWIFNTKTRKLGCYHALDGSGFSVKGTTITNFDPSKSIQKTVRKPNDVIPGILKAGKVALRTALDNIKAVSVEMNGRINKDIVILRVVK